MEVRYLEVSLYIMVYNIPCVQENGVHKKSEVVVHVQNTRLKNSKSLEFMMR